MASALTRPSGQSLPAMSGSAESMSPKSQSAQAWVLTRAGQVPGDGAVFTPLLPLAVRVEEPALVPETVSPFHWKVPVKWLSAPYSGAVLAGAGDQPGREIWQGALLGGLGGGRGPLAAGCAGDGAAAARTTRVRRRAGGPKAGSGSVRWRVGMTSDPAADSAPGAGPPACRPALRPPAVSSRAGSPAGFTEPRHALRALSSAALLLLAPGGSPRPAHVADLDFGYVPAPGPGSSPRCSSRSTSRSRRCTSRSRRAERPTASSRPAMGRQLRLLEARPVGDVRVGLRPGHLRGRLCR